MRRLSFLLPLLIAVASCSSDEPAQPTPVNRVDIVTLEATSPVAKFILDLPGTSGKKVLVASEALGEDLEMDSRMLIEYEASAADTARSEVPIKLEYFSSVLTLPLDPVPHALIEELPSGEATLISQWRTGDWINVQLEAAYNGTQRAIAVAADESTLEDPVVECYIFNPGEPVGPNSVGRRAYASFSIADLNLRPDQKVSVQVR